MRFFCKKHPALLHAPFQVVPCSLLYKQFLFLNDCQTVFICFPIFLFSLHFFFLPTNKFLLSVWEGTNALHISKLKSQTARMPNLCSLFLYFTSRAFTTHRKSFRLVKLFGKGWVGDVINGCTRAYIQPSSIYLVTMPGPTRKYIFSHILFTYCNCSWILTTTNCIQKYYKTTILVLLLCFCE